MPRLFLFALLFALLSGCVAPAPAPTFTPTPFSTDTPQPSKTPSPTVTEPPTATATQTETATATEAQTLNPAEMQTESGVHGVKLDATGIYQGITQNVSVGITPDVNEFFGGKGVEFNDEASTIPVGDRLAEVALRAWYSAYLQRNNLSATNYSFETYLADYKSGKDVAVDEWVYDPVTKTNSVMKVGPDTHVTYVSAEGMGWYGVIHYYENGLGNAIVRAPEGIIMVSTSLAFSNPKSDKLGRIDTGVMSGLLWLSIPLAQQNGEEKFNLTGPRSPEYNSIISLVHPGYFSGVVDTYLVTPVSP